MNLGILANTVQEVTLVDGLGNICHYSVEKEPDLFYGVIVSLGSLGIFCEFTLKVVDAFLLEEVQQPISVSDFLDNMDTILSENGSYNFRIDSVATFSDHVKLWIIPETFPPSARMWLQNKTEKKKTSGFFPRFLREINRNSLVHLFEFILNILHFFPFLHQPVMKILGKLALSKTTVREEFNFCLNKNQSQPYVDQSYQIFTTGYIPRHMETEWAIPVEKTAFYLRKLLEMYSTEKHRMNFITEVRFVKSDLFWLSPAYLRNVCFLTPAAFKFSEQERNNLIQSCDKLFMDPECRPHWGKHFFMGHVDLQTRFPCWEKFLELRKKMDPHQIFVNEFLTRVLGL
jgi:FAD/FMN-containing dehydrogenase